MKTNYDELIELMSWAYGEGYSDLLKNIKSKSIPKIDFQQELFKKCKEMEEEELKNPNGKNFIQQIIEIAIWSFDYGNKSKLDQVLDFEPKVESLPQRLVEYVESKAEDN